MKFSPTEQRLLKLMIVDCELHYMTENQSRGYINKRFGRRISRRTYYNYKVKAYEGYEKIRLGPKWLRGIHLGSMLFDMENTPLILEKRLA